MNTADIGVVGPVNGLGEEHKAGSYIRVSIAIKEEKRSDVLISHGAAEVLADELRGILARLPGREERAAMLTEAGE